MVLYFAGRLSAFRQSGILVPRFSRKRERDARARNRGDRSPRASVLAAMCSSTHGAVAKRLCGGLQSRSGRFDSGSRLQDYSDAGIRLASLLEPSGCVRQSSATSTCVDVCRRARHGGFYSLCISLLIDCRALAGPARARGRRARRGRIDIPSTSVSGRHRTRFAECAAGGGFAGASEAAMSAHRAIVRCRARQRPRPFPRARGATGGAATSRRAGFGRASRAQAGVTSARSK